MEYLRAGHSARALRTLVPLLGAALLSIAAGRSEDLANPSPPESPPTEAPTGFDGETNGLVTQEQFDEDLEIFDEAEEIDEGLGPVYNARGCGECHGNPVIGAISQITEMRAGQFNGQTFTDHPGGSLIHSRAIDARIQERLSGSANVRTFRTSLNTLGDGFVEAISNSTIESIAAHQPSSLRGTIVRVPVLEANNSLRIGRFGWKAQHASLVSFSADAYLNEMGITSPFAPDENTSNGNSVEDFDEVPDPEEAPTPEEPAGPDIEAFARFMRATKAPPIDDAGRRPRRTPSPGASSSSRSAAATVTSPTSSPRRPAR